MSQEKYLSYRGEIRALAGQGSELAFVTRHAEGQPMFLVRISLPEVKLEETPLPAGGTALLLANETYYIGSDDGQVLAWTKNKRAPVPLGPRFGQPIRSLAWLAPAVAAKSTSKAVPQNRLAILQGMEIAILDFTHEKVVQTLALPAAGTALAADPSGQWLIAGCESGDVCVFQAEDQMEWVPSHAAKLHTGAVTALLFEPEELRFYSTGADLKLLLTHARGKLEPEDRGRTFQHQAPITSLALGPGRRLYSGSLDKTVKTWTRGDNKQPSTLKDLFTSVVGLALCAPQQRAQLVVAGHDQTLHFFPLDGEGRIGPAALTLHGAQAWAEAELTENDPGRREAALDALASWGDLPAHRTLSERVKLEPDHDLQVRAVRLLGDSRHAQARDFLPPHLKHESSAVRLAAWQGLRKHYEPGSLLPIDAALAAGQADVGQAATEALQGLARDNDQALSRLIKCLKNPLSEVRIAALSALENVIPDDVPEADILGLQSGQVDVMQKALARLFQRNLHRHPQVGPLLRQLFESGPPEVAQQAFFLAIATRERLATALRSRAPELDRQLTFWEGRAASATAPAEAKTEAKSKPARGKAKKAKGVEESAPETADHEKLSPEDQAPLLQAVASREVTISLAGAVCLALLHDGRGLGVLLQLSRDGNPVVRVKVCQALQELDDPRAQQRLQTLLHDSVPEVRDAAFSALARLPGIEPLALAATCLNATHEDVRRHGLQRLVAELRKKAPQGPAEPAWQLLLRALNDGFPAIRREAFKSALNLNFAGGGVKTLRFLTQSAQEDVRREVLIEVQALTQSSPEEALLGAGPLLLEFLNDPAPALRTEAFEFATEKLKGRELGPLRVALEAAHQDIRLLAVQSLAKKPSESAQGLLLKALDDPAREIRDAALSALVTEDAQQALTKALGNPHPEVRVRAATARARHGDSFSRQPLLNLATTPEPQEKERQAEWEKLAVEALEGLAVLGDPSVWSELDALFASSRSKIRGAVARVLREVPRGLPPGRLASLLQHSDPQVREAAALALALNGDPVSAGFVFSGKTSRAIGKLELLNAALALGPAGEDVLAGLLELPEIQRVAWLTLLLRAVHRPTAEPEQLLPGLSALHPGLRLTAAEALLACAQPAEYLAFLVKEINDRGEEPPGKMTANLVADLAALLACATPDVQARTVQILPVLLDPKPGVAEQAWKLHLARYADELKAARAVARKSVPPAPEPAALRTLAFGALVGLVRADAAGQAKGLRESQVVRIRQAALLRLHELAKLDPALAAAAQPVFVQVLRHGQQAVRQQALAQLIELGMPPAAAGGEALTTPYLDLGVQGLKLMIEAGSAQAGTELLEQAMLTRTDEVALEAAKFLTQARTAISVGAQALDALSPQVRGWGIRTLVAHDEDGPAARAALRKAVTSRYPDVQIQSLTELAQRQDAAAFPALVQLLNDRETSHSLSNLIGLLGKLNDARVDSALLDFLERNSFKKPTPQEILGPVTQHRRPDAVPRLLALVDQPRTRDAVLETLLAISGYDQEPPADLEHPEVEEAGAKKHPFRADVLAQLLEKGIELSLWKQVARWLSSAQWAVGNEVNAPLARLLFVAADDLRQQAVQILGWRLRYRRGPAEPLLQALDQRDPLTRFYAAEGLALAQRSEGLNLLLASVELADDLALRKRAVVALGELGEPAALPLLLKLADQDDHVLRGPAAEALGHLGHGPRSEAVFSLLERLSRADGLVNQALASQALTGLRWLNTPAAWQRILAATRSQIPQVQSTALGLLGESQDPAARETLLHFLRGESQGYCDLEAALKSARKLFGPDSCEPDLALMQNAEFDLFVDAPSLKRVADRATSAQILAILPAVMPEVREALRVALLRRPPLEPGSLKSALAHDDPDVVEVAAHLLGRQTAIGPAFVALLRDTLSKWHAKWRAVRARNAGRAPFERDDLRTTERMLETLCWAVGRQGGAETQLAELVRDPDSDPSVDRVRQAAATALWSAPANAAARGTGPAAREICQELLRTGRPELRAEAAAAWRTYEPKPTHASVSAEDRERLVDPSVARRMTPAQAVAAAPLVKELAQKIHYQGIALPILVLSQDLAALEALASDAELSEPTRQGALESLLREGSEEAQRLVRKLAKAPQTPEALRNVAWRGLRRAARRGYGRTPGSPRGKRFGKS